MLVAFRLMFSLRRSRQFKDQRRVEPRQGAEGKFRAAVVGFIHNHHGPVKFQQVCQRIDRARNAVDLVERGDLFVGQVGEVVHQDPCVVIDLQALGILVAAFILAAKGLDGGDDHHGPARRVGLGHCQRLGLGHHRKVAVEGLKQGRAVVVGLVLQGGDSLVQDRRRWHKPQHHGVCGLKVVARGDAYGMRGHTGLAAPGGTAKADKGGAFRNGGGLAIGELGGLHESHFRAQGRAVAQEGAELAKGEFLVLFQVEVDRCHVKPPQSGRGSV